MKAKACKAKARHSNSFKRGAKIAAKRGAEGMEIVNPHAGGIDCGAQEHYVAVPPQSVEPGEPFVRCFSAFTEGLDALVEWLKACGVTTVAIESTGVYWIALCQKLEVAGIEVFLVNARHVRHVPGRKTDGPSISSCWAKVSKPTASTRLGPKSATLKLRDTCNNWPSGSNHPAHSEPSCPGLTFLTMRRPRTRSLPNGK